MLNYHHNRISTSSSVLRSHYIPTIACLLLRTVGGDCLGKELVSPVMNESATPKILDITSGDESTIRDVIDQVVPILSAGGVIAVPTDTLYGIACSVDSDEGIRKLYEIKQRSISNPISICVADLECMQKWADITVSESILNRLFPGQVTAVFTRKKVLNMNLNPRTSLIGIRIPDHHFIRQLVKSCPSPLALTSANKSGSPSTLEIKEFKELWPMLNAVIDSGKIHDQEFPDCRKGSTVINLSVEGYYQVIRQGSSCREVVKILRDKGIKEYLKDN